jgi:predicted nucleotidyltransferase
VEQDKRRHESDEQVAAAVRECLQRAEGVMLGYLFGSRAQAKSGPLSDVDVAVLPAAGADRMRLEDELAAALVRALGTERVDLVMLDEAPPPLRYRVARDGRLLVCTDHGVRQRFVTATVMEYLDFKPVRDAAFRAAREAILRGE